MRWALFCAAAAAATLSGCGDQSRPVVTPSNPSGPASQVTSYAVAITAPTSNSSGLATVIDYSGDSIMASAKIGPDAAVSPIGFTIDYSGSTGYTINSDGSLSNFPISTSLKDSNITYSTLTTSTLSAPQPVAMFSPYAALWVADVETSSSSTDDAVDIMSSSPATYQAAVSVAPTPVALTGLRSGGKYYYSISRNNVDTASDDIAAYNEMSCNSSPATVSVLGEADVIDVSLQTREGRISLGACPVYAVTSSDGLRVFVLNRGSDTISVINTANGALNSCTSFTDTHTGRTVTCHPTLPLSQAALSSWPAPVNCDTTSDATCGMPAVAGPVFAEYNAATSQLVVADYDGGTVSVVDVSLDEYGNDSATFGTTYTITLPRLSSAYTACDTEGTYNPYPASLAVLSDGSRAYVANQYGSTDSTCANGDVSVLNLSSHIVEKSLAVTGHPRTVVSTNNSTNGKVYVASPDSDVLTVINTYTDAVTASLALPGDIIDVRTTTKDGTSGSNTNVTSWIPGSGRPCNTPASSAVNSLEECMAPLSLTSTTWLTNF